MSLEAKVRAELLAIRRKAEGLTVAAMTESPVISGLLGDGDPTLANSRLRLAVLESELGLSIQAVASSFGLTSSQRSHLGRLEDFGAEYGYDQRQARRYSDRGIHQLAHLIATNLAVTSVPCLDVVLVQSGAASVDVMVSTKCLWFVEMAPPVAMTRRGEAEPATIGLTLVEREDDGYRVGRTKRPVTVDVIGETSLTIVWRGELWPKFSVTWAVGALEVQSTVETLGNKLMLRLWPLLAA